MKFKVYLIIALLLFYFIPGTTPALGKKKSNVKPPVKKTVLKIKNVDKKAPGFFHGPDIYPKYVINPDFLPVLTFAADENVSVTVEAREGSGQHRLQEYLLAAADFKKEDKIEVAWKLATIPNGKYNFHIVMIDKSGNRTEYNAPFTYRILNNPNRDLILY